LQTRATIPNRGINSSLSGEAVKNHSNIKPGNFIMIFTDI
jgi:hypothetical protein